MYDWQSVNLVSPELSSYWLKKFEEIWTQNNCQKSFVFNLLSRYFAYKAFSRLKDAFKIEHQQNKDDDPNEQSIFMGFVGV